MRMDWLGSFYHDAAMKKRKRVLPKGFDMKPGFLTTEFWLSAVTTVIGLVMASGLVHTGSTWEKVFGLAAAALASMGYSASRGQVKALNQDGK